MILLPSEPNLDSEMTSKLKSHESPGSHFLVTRGDYAPILQKVVEHLEKAKVGALWAEVCRLAAPLGSKGGYRDWGRPEADQPPCSPPGICSQQPPGTDAGPVHRKFHPGPYRGPQEGLSLWIQDKGPRAEVRRQPPAPPCPAALPAHPSSISGPSLP